MTKTANRSHLLYSIEIIIISVTFADSSSSFNWNRRTERTQTGYLEDKRHTDRDRKEHTYID